MKKDGFIFHFTITSLMVLLLILSGCGKKIFRKEEAKGLKSEETTGREEGAESIDEEKPEIEVDKIIKEAIEEMTEPPSRIKEEDIIEEPVGGIESERDQGLEEDIEMKISRLGEEFKEGDEDGKKDVSEISGEEEGLLPIFFDYDRYQIRKSDRDILKKNARWFIDHPEAKVTIAGHADERGSDEYNLALGERRAKSTQEYLKNLGIENTLRIISYGEEMPICKDHHEGCWSRNRRAEFIIISE